MIKFYASAVTEPALSSLPGESLDYFATGVYDVSLIFYSIDNIIQDWINVCNPKEVKTVGRELANKK